MTPRLIVAVALVAAAYGTYRFRKAWLPGLFVRGAGGAEAPALAMPGGGPLPGLAPVERVRVVLIDGVDRTTAHWLPNWSAVCGDGLELIVDVGYPSVSLPVQRVLWTGLTQQQSGVLFVGGYLGPPPLGIPAQVPGSMAIAESHQGIAHSLGFAQVLPDRAKVPPGWGFETRWPAWLGLERGDGFAQAARQWVATDLRLVFVHVLVTDSVGHRAGRASQGFRAAAAWADGLLGELRAAERAAHPDGRTRWFVLADHGHRAGGGHGDAEPWIRQVRGCIAGDATPTSPGGVPPYVHLVDFSRAIADSLAVPLPAESAGRPLGAALAAPVDEEATLPRPGTLRWLAAIALLFVALLATGLAARGRLTALPWWWPVAYLSLIWIELPPSLTTHMVYRPWGEIIWKAALPGLCLLAIGAPLALRALAPVRVVIAQLALPVAIALAALVLSGGADLGMAGDPPLIPMWTGRASAFLVLAASGMVVAGLAVLASAVPSGSGRTTAGGTRRRSP